MHQIAVRLKFEAAHRLYPYQGKCANIHGHNYMVEVVVGSSNLGKSAMVVDFGDLRRAFQGSLDACYDHRLILSKYDPHVDVFAALEFDLCLVSGSPTAETLSEELYQLFDGIVTSRSKDAYVEYVRVYENSDSWAEFS